MKIKMILFSLLIITNVYAGDSFYISPKGNNGNSGTIGSPWRNLEVAITRTSPGDTLFMRGLLDNKNQPISHIMNEVWIDRNKGYGGREGLYLTIKNFPGERPHLKYGSRRLIIAADFVRIEGLDVEMPWRFDVFGVGNQIVNNILTGPQPQFGAIETGGRNVLIEGNFIEFNDTGGNTKDHGIYVHAGSNITILENIIIRPKGYGIHVFDQRQGSSFKGYLIQGNFISDCQTRAGIILATQGNVTMTDMTVQYNISVNNNWYGLFLREGTDIKVFNNTFSGNTLQPLRVENAENIEIKNNIFSRVNESNNNNISLLKFIAINDIDTNLFFNVEAFGENPIISDPLFNEDYSLQEGSPAIDVGLNLGLPFMGSAPDLGAREFDFVTNISNIMPLSTFILNQNYPNPFNPRTTITYHLKETQLVTINIYNILGQKIDSLINSIQHFGDYSITWDGTNRVTGLYLYQLNDSVLMKMFLVK